MEEQEQQESLGSLDQEVFQEEEGNQDQLGYKVHLGSGRAPQDLQVTLVIQGQGELLEILSEDPQEQLEHKVFLDQMHQDHGIQGLEA